MDSLSIPAKAIMPKPLPTLRSASRRVSGDGDLNERLWVMIIPSVDKQKFGGTEQKLRVAAPHRGLVLDLNRFRGPALLPRNTRHHSHTHFGGGISRGRGIRFFSGQVARRFPARFGGPVCFLFLFRGFPKLL